MPAGFTATSRGPDPTPMVVVCALVGGGQVQQQRMPGRQRAHQDSGRRQRCLQRRIVRPEAPVQDAQRRDGGGGESGTHRRIVAGGERVQPSSPTPLLPPLDTVGINSN